jgi:hypothetical protein
MPGETQRIGTVIIGGDEVMRLGEERISKMAARICGEAFASCPGRESEQGCHVQEQISRVLSETREAGYACDSDSCDGSTIEGAALDLHTALRRAANHSRYSAAAIAG